MLGSKDHGWVSSKQHWYMESQDFLEKVRWDEFMEEEANRFKDEVSLAKSEGRPYNVEDGAMRARFEGEAACV